MAALYSVHMFDCSGECSPVEDIQQFVLGLSRMLSLLRSLHYDLSHDYGSSRDVLCELEFGRSVSAYADNVIVIVSY